MESRKTIRIAIAGLSLLTVAAVGLARASSLAAQGGHPPSPNVLAAQGGHPPSPNVMTAQGGHPPSPNVMV
jgi:hypothetical protein